ncbi:hypothetical protein ABFS83_07G051600 [Erythranthe nasuta]
MNLTKDVREEENTPDLQSERETRTPNNCQELYLRNNIHRLHSTIPKHITTVDEKYILHCLQLIRNCARRAAAQDFASKVHVLSNDVSILAEGDMARLAIECPNSSDDMSRLTIGSVTSSQSMKNILNSPLLQQTRHVDFFEPVYSRKNSAPGQHKRAASVSSTNSSFSDKSSSSASNTSYQAMMQCTWRDGLPHHVFSVDDKRESYVASLEPSGDKVYDYVYTFHSRKKEHEIQELESENLGTMRVSTSITLCSNNMEVRETNFVLSLSSDENPTKDRLQNSNLALRKNKRLLTRKVANVFRSNYKKRPSSKFTGSSAILEDSPWEPSGNEDNNNNTADEQREYSSPNLELAAVIVKDVRKNPEIGGWGLKFLKKTGANASLEASARGLPECSRSKGECSTSMDVLIPAGLHGGPRARGGAGPSSLTERWISGGQCDCGGWDIGCPLTILKTKSSSADSSFSADSSEDCKSIDLFIQGSKEEDMAMLKMVKIHEGLYYIHYQSTLSSLQSFAIAAAIFHSRSPLLRPKNIQ